MADPRSHQLASGSCRDAEATEQLLDFPKSTSASLAPIFFKSRSTIELMVRPAGGVASFGVSVCVSNIPLPGGLVGSLLGSRRHHSSMNDVQTLSNQA